MKFWIRQCVCARGCVHVGVCVLLTVLGVCMRLVNTGFLLMRVYKVIFSRGPLRHRQIRHAHTHARTPLISISEENRSKQNNPTAVTSSSCQCLLSVLRAVKETAPLRRAGGGSRTHSREESTLNQSIIAHPPLQAHVGMFVVVAVEHNPAQSAF